MMPIWDKKVQNSEGKTGKQYVEEVTLAEWASLPTQLVVINYSWSLEENLALSVIIHKSVIVRSYLTFHQVSAEKGRLFGTGSKTKPNKGCDYWRWLSPTFLSKRKDHFLSFPDVLTNSFCNFRDNLKFWLRINGKRRMELKHDFNLTA